MREDQNKIKKNPTNFFIYFFFNRRATKLQRSRECSQKKVEDEIKAGLAAMPGGTVENLSLQGKATTKERSNREGEEGETRS